MTTLREVRYGTLRAMGPEQDRLQAEMAIERVQRDDGRLLLLYSWPRPSARPARPAGEAPPLEPWSPEAGPADV